MDSETPSDGTWRFLWCWLSFCFSSLFCFQAALPWHQLSTLASQAREGLHQLWALPNYFWLPFLFHLPRALRFCVGIFYRQAFFTLRSFPKFLVNLLLSRPPWELAVLPGSFQGFMLILEMQTQPVCIYTCQYCKSFTCGENFEKKIIFLIFSSW